MTAASDPPPIAGAPPLPATEAETLARARADFLARVPCDRDVWVFGYGSLLWNPGFVYCDARPAVLHGFHRAFCIYSQHYRGTVERPGLVLGLDRGGSCRGMAFRVDCAEAQAALAYLWDREMVTAVYRPHPAPVRLLDASRPDGMLRCLAFVADRDHPQYAGGLSPQQVARLVHRGAGSSGTNRDYLDSTVDRLAQLGIRDRRLSAIQALVHGLDAEG
ncbi:MAG: gamma-glutamylcyclotransferase [Alphaproteobacteria bacterium]